MLLFGNNSICGLPFSFPQESLLGILIKAAIGSLVILVTLLILCKKKGGFQDLCLGKTMDVNNRIHSDDGLVFFGKEGEREFGLDQLLATDAEVMGKGVFGSGVFGTSYKSNLEGRNAVVVKRLRGSRCFGKEKIEELGRMVHGNLMPLKAYYHGKDETFLLCDYMPNGSLSDFLHGKDIGTNKTPLNWHVRRKIAYGVARGIEYLHSQGPDVCHGNIRSSNILLSDSFDAHLSDFGIAQLLSDDSNLNCIAGYRAPEVTNDRKVSQKADIFSFGVLLLELLTGKAPMLAVPNSKGEDLPKWARLMIREKPIIDVFDQKLLVKKDIQEEMFLILQLAICCTFEYPKNRPSMAVVANRIRDISDAGS